MHVFCSSLHLFNDHIPWTLPLSRKLLKLNVELLDARYCINLCKATNWIILIITRIHGHCFVVYSTIYSRILYNSIAPTSFPYASRWCVVSNDLYTTTQFALCVRSTSKLAKCGIDTFGSFVQCTKSGRSLREKIVGD